MPNAVAAVAAYLAELAEQRGDTPAVVEAWEMAARA